MTPKEFRRIREKLDLSPEQLAGFLGLSGYGSIMNIENGVRRPNKLAMKILLFLDAMTVARAKKIIEEVNKHEPN